jgi:glutamyl-tRNA(Gln) amidotransferase subunit E
MEKKTKKNIYYRLHRETVCTYEMDDTPPFFPDDEAVDTALELSMLLRLSLVGELHIARKQYLDGSIPTGFQRTTIFGVDGSIPFAGRQIGIAQLGMEEDSCREVSDVGHDRVYLTDRLGMPLIEVVTYPDMRTPEECAAVGEVIRKLCRSTGRVRTGYGAAREDVNVSVRGGTRIEIKGVPQLTRIPRLIYNEAFRQCSLLRIREELHRRGITPETFAATWRDVTRLVGNTTYEPLRAALSEGHEVRAIVLRGFGGLLAEPTQEHTTFAREFSDRIRVIACLTRLPNMVHSDTASDTLAGKHWKEIRRKLRAEAEDAVILVWGSAMDVETACLEIANRGREATVGVPSDTRQANRDGTNGFERVLPGPERMYPDTDLPPLEIDEARRQRIRARMPQYFWEREERYRKLGIPADTISELAISPRADLFEKLIAGGRVNPVFAAVVLVQRFRAWRREGLRPDDLADALLAEVFEHNAADRLPREGVLWVLNYLLRNPQAAVAPAEAVLAAIAALGLRAATAGEVAQQIEHTKTRVKSAAYRNSDDRYRHAMGVALRGLRGRVRSGEVAQRVADLAKAPVSVEKTRA